MLGPGMKRLYRIAAGAALLAAGALLSTTYAARASGADLPLGAMSPVPSAAGSGGAPGGSGGPDAVSPTPVPGIVEVRRGAEIVYMSRDGKYVFTGDMYRVAGHADLTEARRRELRRELIGAVPESQMVVFSPPDPKYTVTVFTDVDCVYCRALQSQIKDYNDLGIKVRYMFFPRTGPNTGSWYKAEQVWCSTDRRSALTRAKLGEPLDTPICKHTPVAREYALGQKIGLDGTPGIVAADGAVLGGYLPPAQLLAALKRSALPPTSGGG